MEIEKQSVVVLTYKIEPRFACMLKSVVWYLYCACLVPELFRKYRPYLFSTYVQRKINSLIIITNFLINNKFNSNHNNISIKKIFYFIWLPLKIVKPNIGTAPSSRLSVRMSVTTPRAHQHATHTLTWMPAFSCRLGRRDSINQPNTTSLTETTPRGGAVVLFGAVTLRLSMFINRFREDIETNTLCHE